MKVFYLYLEVGCLRCGFLMIRRFPEQELVYEPNYNLMEISVIYYVQSQCP
jgi:hypothetical protein